MGPAWSSGRLKMSYRFTMATASYSGQFYPHSSQIWHIFCLWWSSTVLKPDGIFGFWPKQLNGLKSDLIPWNYMFVSKVSRLTDKLFGRSCSVLATAMSQRMLKHPICPSIWICGCVVLPHIYLVQDSWSSQSIFQGEVPFLSRRSYENSQWNPHEVPISPMKLP